MKDTVRGLVLPVISGTMAAVAVLGIVEVTRSPEPPEATPRAPAEVQVVQVADPSAMTAPGDAAGAPSRDPAWQVTPGGTGEFVSLTTHVRQRIPRGTYTQLRFEGEPTDAPGWHEPGSPLIVPTRTAVAHVCYKVTWADDGRPSQYFVQIARDPDGYIDVTGAQDSPNTVGRDYRALCWAMKVRAGQPLAIRVKHDGSQATAVEFAEFKVWVP